MTFEKLEAVPSHVTDELKRVATDLGCEMPVYVPVEYDDAAKSNTPVLNVVRACRLWGGKPVFGWKLSQALKLFVCARFHVVRMTAGGLLVDESPNENAARGKYCLFAVDPSIGNDFNFRASPPDVRARIFEAPNSRFGGPNGVSAAIDSYLEALSEFDTLYEPTAWGRRCVDPSKLVEKFEHIHRAHRRLRRVMETEGNPLGRRSSQLEI